MLNGKKIIVVMPAFNAARTLERTYRELPFELVDEVLLVDDASRDATVELSRSLGLRTILHEKNLGYGRNQKTCYREAVARYFAEASSINFTRSVKYGLGVLITSIKFRLQKMRHGSFRIFASDGAKLVSSISAEQHHTPIADLMTVSRCD